VVVEQIIIVGTDVHTAHSACVSA